MIASKKLRKRRQLMIISKKSKQNEKMRFLEYFLEKLNKYKI